MRSIILEYYVKEAYDKNENPVTVGAEGTDFEIF